MEGTGDAGSARTDPNRSRASAGDDDWLSGVARGASHDAGDVPVKFLGGYLPMLAEAATSGRRHTRRDLEAVRLMGRRAAESGVSARRGVDLYLSAARRVWLELPAVVRERDSAAVRSAAEALLLVMEGAVSSFAEGHAEAGREMVRWEETLRRALVEDLLRGDGHLGELVERAEPFGLDLTRPHQVALARPGERLSSVEAATSSLERVVVDRFGDRDVLVTTKEGMVVVLVPDGGVPVEKTSTREQSTRSVGALIHSELSRLRQGSPWRVAVGRVHPGAYGIARSYEEAREGLMTATRMQLETPVVEGQDLLIYRVLFRDQPAIVDLVNSVLSPLAEARGGARPLLDTLEAYFATGGVATAAALRLHLSVRAVTYRLDRVRTLTAHDPVDPAHRVIQKAAVVGAELRGGPGHEQPNTRSPGPRPARSRPAGQEDWSQPGRGALLAVVDLAGGGSRDEGTNGTHVAGRRQPARRQLRRRAACLVSPPTTRIEVAQDKPGRCHERPCRHPERAAPESQALRLRRPGPGPAEGQEDRPRARVPPP
jgi:hypothetical protein